MVVLDDLKNLMIYKKPFFLPIDDKDKKNNSAIMLLTPNYKSSVNTMKAPYLINRRNFESYYMEKNVYRYITKDGKTETPVEEQYLFEVSEEYLNGISVLDEGKVDDPDLYFLSKDSDWNENVIGSGTPFSSSVDEFLKQMSDVNEFNGMKFYVYKPDGYYDITTQTSTNEKRIEAPVTLKCIGSIMVTGNPNDFTYEWIETYTNDGGIIEEALTSGKRKRLPDDTFGIPKYRRYPMPDKEHVLMAIRFFNHIEEKFEKELADNITKKIKEFKMESDVHVTQKNRYYPYWIKAFPQSTNEASIKEKKEENLTPPKNGKEIIDAVNSSLEKEGLKAHLSKNGEWGIDNFLSGKSKSLCLGSFNKDTYNKAYSTVQDALKPLGAKVSKDNYFTLFVREGAAIKEAEDDYAFSYYFNDEIKKKFNDTVDMSTSDDEIITESLNEFLYNSNLPILTESEYAKEAKKGNYYPIFIVNSFTFTKFGKLSHKVTPKLVGEFSHSGISFGPGLNTIYSYNMANGVSKKGGFSIESIKGYLNKNINSKISVNVFFVKAKWYKVIHEYIRGLKDNVKSTSYSIADLFRIMLGKVNKKASLNMVCSEFVYNVIKMIGADPLHKDLVTPDELHNLKDGVKVFGVFNGLIKDYNPSKIQNQIEAVKDKAKLITESDLMNTILDESSNMKKIETCTGVIVDHLGRILVEKHKRTGVINLPGGKMEPGETELECLKRELKEEINLDIQKARFLYDFTFKFKYLDDNADYLCLDHLYFVSDFNGTYSNMEMNKHDYVKFVSIEELVISNDPLSEILKRFIAQYGAKLRKDPINYLTNKVSISNLVYTGDEGGLRIAQQYINMKQLKGIFDKCSIPYPKTKILVIVSSAKQEYGYIDDSTITVLSMRAFSEEFPHYNYADYVNFIMATFVYCTINPKVSSQIVNPLAMYKSGSADAQMKNLKDRRFDVERIFQYIDKTYGDKAIITIVKNNDMRLLYKYGKELFMKTNRLKEFALMESEYNLLSEDEINKVEDITNIGAKITRKIKGDTVYKLNKIKRDIQRGNVGTESRGSTTLQRVQNGDIVQTDVSSIKPPDDSSNSTTTDTTSESADYMMAMAHDEYLVNENTIFFFEDALNYDLMLRNALYADRIRNTKQIMAIYKQVKQDCPFLRWTFTNLERYGNKNLFVDLSFYNESYFRSIMDEKAPDPNNIKTAKIYTELLKRLINDNRINQYKKKTIFIPVLDWRHNNSTRMWMFKEDINPISMIYRMMRTEPSTLKDMFKNTNLIFMGPNNYFKLCFDEVDFGKDQVVMKFMNGIKRLITLGFTSVDPDPVGEPTNSPKGIALDLIDKVEKSQNIEIKSVEPVMKAVNKVLEIPPDKAPTPEPAVKKVEVEKAPDTTKVTNNKVKVTKIDNLKAIGVDTSKSQNAVNIPDADKQKDELVKMITKAAETSSNTDDAINKLDQDEQFKALLLALHDQENSNARVSASRAARITELSSKFAEKQVAGKSVKDLLSQNPNDIKLPTTKLPVASIDPTWSNMTFMNFDKTYDPDSDIVKMLDGMKNWSYPIGVRDIKVTDNSSSEDLLNLWDIDCEDYKGTRFKMRVDVPQFINDRYLRLRGNDKTIMIQSTAMPIIKTDLDTCQIIGVGGYNKIFVRRYGNGVGKSLPTTDRLIKTLNRYEGKDIIITNGDNTKICNKYELPIDYIDLASYYSKIETDRILLYFNQDELRTDYEIDDTKGLALGVQKADGQRKETIIYYDKAVANDFKTVSAYITYLIPDGMSKESTQTFLDILDTMLSTSKRYTYSRATILGVKIPLIIVCSYVEGLTSTLTKAGINYSFKEKIDKADKRSFEIDYVKFQDGYLIYETSYESCMLMNGLKECDTESYSIKDMNTKQTYLDILSEFGGVLKADGIENSYDCMLDPITKEILEIYKLPTDYVSVLLYSNMLLTDNKYINHTYMGVRRLRRKELIAGYFYKALANAYQSYANQIRHSRRSVKMTMKQSAVIDMILSKDPSTNDVSVNNASNDVEAANTVTNKGLVGMNIDRAYSLDKRGFDESMLNVLGMATGFSANVGINRQATIDCNIEGARGFIKPIDGDINQLGTTKSLTITEALTPFGVTHDDPFRSLMTLIQTSKHMVRTTSTDPLLVTNGADEAMPYLTSDTFAFKAKKDGVIIELNNENPRDAYMVLEYKDGTHEFVDLSEEIKKNSDGGYSVPMKLDTDFAVGKKVKAGDVVAYDKSSFSSSLGESGNLAMNVGTLAKVAIMNTPEGFEDSAAITEQFGRKLGTEVIVKDEKTINKNANVSLMKKIGEQVMQGEVLLRSQMSFDDDVANSLLRNLSMDANEISELGQNPLVSHYSGILQDIKIYRTVETSELSPSLQKLVKQYESPINKRKQIYKQYGLNPNVLPPTSKMENVGKTKNLYDGIIIEFYIRYIDNMGIGDKIVFYSANKGVIKYMIPDGKEPYTDFRPEEPIDAFASTGSGDARMVFSPILYGSIAKLMVELDRTCKDMAGIPYDPSKI